MSDAGYSEGDVNTVDEFDDDNEFDDVNDEADTSEAPIAIEVLEYCARQMADEPDAVSVSTRRVGQRVVLDLKVAPNDMGRVIGRRGRTAQALRTVVAAAGARDGVTTSVDILD